MFSFHDEYTFLGLSSPVEDILGVRGSDIIEPCESLEMLLVGWYLQDRVKRASSRRHPDMLNFLVLHVHDHLRRFRVIHEQFVLPFVLGDVINDIDISMRFVTSDLSIGKVGIHLPACDLVEGCGVGLFYCHCLIDDMYEPDGGIVVEDMYCFAEELLSFVP